MVTAEEFDTLDQDKLQYNYAWTYNEKPQTEIEEKECFRRSDGRQWEKLSLLETFVPQISESGDYIYRR